MRVQISGFRSYADSDPRNSFALLDELSRSSAKVYGLGFKVLGLRFRMWGVGCRVQIEGYQVSFRG